MTSPLAVVTSAISVVVRPHTKPPKPAPPKAGCFHECTDDGRALLDQLQEDAELLNKRRWWQWWQPRRQSVRLFVICDAVDNHSLRSVKRELKHRCGFHESAIVLDPAVDAQAAKTAIDKQLEVLHECNDKIKRSAKARIQNVHKHKDDEDSEVIVSYVTFTLELKWS